MDTCCFHAVADGGEMAGSCMAVDEGPDACKEEVFLEITWANGR